MSAFALGQVFNGLDRTDEIRMESGTFSADFVGAGSAISVLNLQANGDVLHNGVGTLSNGLSADEWHRDNPVASLGDDWEVRATVTAGSLTSGTTGSYEALSTTRSWSKSHSATPAATVTLTLDFRLIASPSVLVTVTGVVLSAQASPI